MVHRVLDAGILRLGPWNLLKCCWCLLSPKVFPAQPVAVATADWTKFPIQLHSCLLSFVEEESSGVVLDGDGGREFLSCIQTPFELYCFN
jgi:hypothetical protein